MRAVDRAWRSLLRCLTAGILLAFGSLCAQGDEGVRRVHEPASMAWGGVYVGGHLGAGRADTDWHFANDNYFNTFGATLVGSNFNLDASGAIGGGQAGFNHQTGPWVLGIEATTSAAGLREARASPFFPAIDTFETSIDWLATVAARVGYAQGRWLAYAKAGWAGADVRLRLHDTTAGIGATAGRWVNGWTVGTGAEYALRPGVSLGLAYDYVRLETDGWTVTCPLCGSGVGFGTPVVDGDIATHAVTARLNYRLGR
jgi:outer membrane immunogenic protein